MSDIVFKEVKLDDRQTKGWAQTRTGLLWQAPGFTHIFYKMLRAGTGKDDRLLWWSDEIPTLGTDDTAIIANAEYFFSLTLAQRIFAICHEIAHAMFYHCGQSRKYAELGTITVRNKTYPFVPMIANHAQDYIINDMLIVSKIGEYKGGWLHDRSIGTYDDSWLDVYERLYKATKGDASKLGTGGNTGAPGQKQFDQHMRPGTCRGKTPDQADEARNEQQWRLVAAEAAAITKEALGRGDQAGALIKFFEQFLESRVSWVEHIAAELARKVGSGGYDWRRPDRRLIVRDIYAPSRSGGGVDVVVIGADSSGSIYAVKDLIARFFGEMGGILLELKPREIHIVWCDSRVQRVDIIEDEAGLADVFYKGAKGGGGTRFTPVFDYIAEMDLKPAALVYLTDGDGVFPNEAPEYPVVWGDISHNPGKYPFGTVVDIPSDGSA